MTFVPWHDVAGGDGGDASTILTMHGGLGFDHTYMRRGFDRLASDDRRVVFYDHRGNGRSDDAPADSITIEQLADDAAALLDHLGVERATALGHSYGGFVAQEFALRHPDRLDKLVLADTTPGQLGANESPDDTEPGPPTPDEWIALMSQLPANDDEFAAGFPAIAPFYLHDRGDAMLARLDAAKDGTILRVAPMIRGFEVLATWSSVDRLSAIDAPTLLLVGRHDVHTSWPQSTRIARRMPNAEVVIFENSAHFPWIEEPDAFYAALESFLEKP